MLGHPSIPGEIKTLLYGAVKFEIVTSVSEGA